MKRILQSFFFLIIAVGIKPAAAQFPIINFQQLASGLSWPLDVVNPGDASNRLFIVEQPGTIRVYQNGAILSPAFLNIKSLVSFDTSERGLLSLVFHPNYASNRYFFVYYTNLAGDITLTRFQTDAGNPNHVDSSLGVVLLNIPKPFSNHNGGKLIFGSDGDLYFGTGDGGGGGDFYNNAQNGHSLLGKMIRLNVDNFATPPYYSIPTDNPYVADTAVNDEIWTIGMRNPWRWSFDRQTHDMWIADVGQSLWEEINFRAAGTTGGINYGWRCYEATHSYNTTGCNAAAAYTFPIFEYPHNSATGGYSVTGGYVYRGTEYPILNGYYLCADYVSGNGWLIKSNGAGGWDTTRQTWISGISSFGESENGTLYAVTLGGYLFKVNAFNPVPLHLVLFTARNNNGAVTLHWITENENMARQFEVEESTDGRNFIRLGTVQAHNTAGTNEYNFSYRPPIFPTIYYRLKMVDIPGSYTWSPIIQLSPGKKQSPQVFPNVITDHQLHIFPAGNLRSIRIFDAQSRLVVSKEYNNSGAYITIPLPDLPKAIYWVRINSAESSVTEKIIIQ